MSRIFQTNNFKNTVRFAVESIKLNYVIGSSFVVRTEQRKDKRNKEGNSNSVSLIGLQLILSGFYISICLNNRSIVQ